VNSDTYEDLVLLETGQLEQMLADLKERIRRDTLIKNIMRLQRGAEEQEQAQHEGEDPEEEENHDDEEGNPASPPLDLTSPNYQLEDEEQEQSSPSPSPQQSQAQLPLEEEDYTMVTSRKKHRKNNYQQEEEEDVLVDNRQHAKYREFDERANYNKRRRQQSPPPQLTAIDPFLPEAADFPPLAHRAASNKDGADYDRGVSSAPNRGAGRQQITDGQRILEWVRGLDAGPTSPDERLFGNKRKCEHENVDNVLDPKHVSMIFSHGFGQ
jgi:hypothetical protein